MTYQSTDRSRYVAPALEGLYSALDVYSWPLISLAILIRGGGPLSLDRMIGREFCRRSKLGRGAAYRFGRERLEMGQCGDN